MRGDVKPLRLFLRIKNNMRKVTIKELVERREDFLGGLLVEYSPAGEISRGVITDLGIGHSPEYAGEIFYVRTKDQEDYALGIPASPENMRRHRIFESGNVISINSPWNMFWCMAPKGEAIPVLALEGNERNN